MATIEEITEVISDLTFPATREQIISHAREVGATEDVLNDLKTLPNDQFVDVMDVWDGLVATMEEPVIDTDRREGSKPRWKCPSCEISFASETFYREHMQQEHGESPSDIEP